MSDFEGNLSAVNLPQLSEQNISTIFRLTLYSFQLSPPDPYYLGTYLTPEYFPSIAILTNARLLNYFDNSSYDQVDFTATGLNVTTLQFVVVYPKNFTTAALKVTVDGSGVASTVQSNSTHDFTIFSLPSGQYKLALIYYPPNGYYSETAPNYPRIYPDDAVIAGVVVIAAIGVGFLAMYIARVGSESTDDRQR